jgi:enoyl-CoA hydratase
LETLTLAHDGQVAIVRLDRPPVNAVNRQMMSELRECFAALGEDRAVNAVVLAAAGGRAFSAGIDIHELAGGRDGPRTIADTLDPGRYWRDTQHQIRYCPVPVVAAVERAAIGAGFGLVGVCDVIVASETATFALTEIDVGLLGGAAKALRLVGPFKTRMMLLSGQPLTAAELYRLGAAEAVVEEGKAEAHAVEIARRFAAKSPIALRLAKESILRIEGSELEDSYRTEQDYTQRMRTYDDSKEAMAAFREKRDARWTWS